MKKLLCEEEIRVKENRCSSAAPWDFWGPYLSERAWATVREDVSVHGDAWNSFPFEHAHLRAYRWGEDGIGGLCDRYQTLCFSLALWNRKDPILKERLYGLNPNQTNHGEDVKEAYYYTDCTPTSSYMSYLYKYPYEYPYKELVDESRKRGKNDPEFEIYDTKAFDDEGYFDVRLTYAKITYSEIAIKIDVVNCGPVAAEIDVIPQLTFRNTWSWAGHNHALKPKLLKGNPGSDYVSMVAQDNGVEPFPMLDVNYRIGTYYIYASNGAEMYFTENETNFEALGKGKNASPYTKDAFHRKIIKNENATNPKMEGTKGCFHYKGWKLQPKEKKSISIRLSKMPLQDPLDNTDAFLSLRQKEAKEYFDTILTKNLSQREKEIQKQAIASQLWSRQLYLFIVNHWLEGDNIGDGNTAIPRQPVRNNNWKHLVSKHVMVMPDKWEYPWFAAWDLSFHALTVALYDLSLAKDQLWILLTDQFQHPSGQIPAYEWEFSDLNPPIQAWVAVRLFEMEKERTGKGDLDFLHRCFEKLLVNFAWWVNREDALGNNVFEGGFLGLDNIAIFDRSKPIPGGGVLEQSDGTAWVGMFCLNLMRMAMELSKNNENFEPMISKFFQHYIYISNALNQSLNREEQCWSEQDGFYYDVLCRPDGSHQQIPIRSLVGVIPLLAFDFVSDEELRSFTSFYPQYTWYVENKKVLLKDCVIHTEKERKPYVAFSLVGKNARRVLSYIWDQDEFKGGYGLRSLSKFHEKNPFVGYDNEVKYAPAESNISMFGGNSNWRGPIWMPINYLFIETLWKMNQLFGDSLKVKNRNNEEVTLKEMAIYFSKALISIWEPDSNGRCPFMGPYEELSRPNWREHLLFHEYFHGDTGKGLGASHQTGWTALIANILDSLERNTH